MRLQRRNTPVLIVGIVVALIVGSRLLSIALPERSGRVDPHVSLTENQAQQIVQRQRQQQVRAFMAASEGEVSRTEERIREATALATASSLFAAAESLNKRTPESVTALLSGVNAAALSGIGLSHLASRSSPSESNEWTVRHC
jgi:ATPase subunit of ABC transporter with duplicated ATPase domains